VAFNWDVAIIDGHSHSELKNAIFRTSTKPMLTIAKTIKGRGVSFMENRIEWHYKSPNDQELAQALNELKKPL
jgi:transketolase